MWHDWVYTSPTPILMTIVSTVAVYLAVIAYARVFGLRSFSKMSAFDFAMTIALGSLFASTIASPEPPLLLALITFGMLFGGQKLVALARRSPAMKRVVDNTPVLLMRDGAFLYDNLRSANVTPDDLRARLRQANVLRYADVKAVVFETTGDVSVIHGPRDRDVEADLLRDVGDATRATGRPHTAASPGAAP